MDKQIKAGFGMDAQTLREEQIRRQMDNPGEYGREEQATPGRGEERRARRSEAKPGLQSYRKYAILSAIDKGYALSFEVADEVEDNINRIKPLLTYYVKKKYIVVTGKSGRHNFYGLTDSGKAFVEWHRETYGE